MSGEQEQSTILGLLEDQIKQKKSMLADVKMKIDYIETQRDKLLVARSFLREAGEPVEDGEPTLGEAELNKLFVEEEQLLNEIANLEAQARAAEIQVPQPF